MTIISPPKKTTKGRPTLTKDDIEQMRNHIAACALRLFHEDGFDAISMRKIAKEADLTPMTIYRYFDGKIDILSKIWVEIFAELFDQLEMQAKAEKNPEQRLRKAALGYVNYWLENREHYFLVFMSKGIKQTDVQSFIEHKETLQRFGLFTQCLAEITTPQPDEATLKLKSELLICTLNGIAQNLITVSSYPWSTPEEIIDHAIGGMIVC